MTDFFISYNGRDKQWAEWIAWILEEASYSVVIQAWDFRPGSNFVLEMQKATVQAKQTIAVLSDNYLDALYTQPEWAAAFVQDPTGENRTLIPIRVAECKPKGLLQSIVYTDLVNLTDAEIARTTILNALQERAKPVRSPAFPGSPRSRVISEPKTFPGQTPHNIPPSTAHQFVDREEPRETLHQLLQAHDIVAIVDKTGKGGVGKTELAVQYSREHLSDYPGGCCWLYPDRTNLLTQLIEFAYLHFPNFQIPDFLSTDEGKIAYCWRNWLSGRKLLVFDNVTDLQAIRAYLPPSGSDFKVILTTRRNDLPFRPLYLGGLPENASQDLLVKLLGEEESRDKLELVNQLCEFVGHVPLGIYQIAALRQPSGR
ncbi:TIR domain-containing protein [Pannus brasiliensis CCIBt3594]|uniref:TIR domain-containing protein n=1 Tax=Pannus brasiliensis CCIBt3594 TaxID=1427578 RepID=A0AAW9QS94_9CHRO